MWGRLIEIGGNATKRFQDELRKRCGQLVSVEINALATCDRHTTTGLKPGRAALVASYCVLEHVLRPGDFLAECRRLVDRTGIDMVEVPDLGFYECDPGALDFPEHVNHFSRRTLAALGTRVGLECVEISVADRSRPFGIVAVFRAAE